MRSSPEAFPGLSLCRSFLTLATWTTMGSIWWDVLDSENTTKFIQEDLCLVLRCSVEGTSLSKWWQADAVLLEGLQVPPKWLGITVHESSDDTSVDVFHYRTLDPLGCLSLCWLEGLPVCSTSCPLVFLIELVFSSGLTVEVSCHPGLMPLRWCHLYRDVRCHGVVEVGLKLLPVVLDGVIIQSSYEALRPALHVFLNLQPPGFGDDKYLPERLPVEGRWLRAVHNYRSVVVGYPRDDSCGRNQSRAAGDVEV